MSQSGTPENVRLGCQPSLKEFSIGRLITLSVMIGVASVIIGEFDMVLERQVAVQVSLLSPSAISERCQ